MNNVLVDFFCCDKQLRRKVFAWVYKLQPHHWGKSEQELKAGTWSKHQTPGSCIKVTSICLEMAEPTMGWAFLHPLLIQKKSPHCHSHMPIWWRQVFNYSSRACLVDNQDWPSQVMTPNPSRNEFYQVHNVKINKRDTEYRNCWVTSMFRMLSSKTVLLLGAPRPSFSAYLRPTARPPFSCFEFLKCPWRHFLLLSQPGVVSVSYQHKALLRQAGHCAPALSKLSSSRTGRCLRVF